MSIFEYIYEKLFPCNIEKYITFKPYSKINSNNYDYWNEAINLILPLLEKEKIKVIQMGDGNDKPINGAVNILGQASIQQEAYLIKNAIMHFGADNIGCQIASMYSKKILAIYSSHHINNTKPYWSKEEDCILIYPNDIKPNYSSEESNKNINKINPEQIAEGILNLLNIEIKDKIKTKFIGTNYINKSLEVVPSVNIDTTKINVDTLVVRMDYLFDEKALEKCLQNKKCIILTDKPINIELLKLYKNNILNIIYLINKENEPIFVKNLKNSAIKYTLLSYLSEESLADYKLDYMDHGLIIRKDLCKKPEVKGNDKLFYMSSRTILSDSGIYYTKYHWLNKLQNNEVIDNPLFWEDSDNLYLYSIYKT
jgi:hypothetical protein